MLETTERDQRMMLALCKNVHGIVDLNIHVVANCRQLVSLGRYDFAILRFDLVRGRAFLGEAAGDNDAVAVLFVPVCVFPLVLQDDRDLRGTGWIVNGCERTDMS